MTGADPDPDTRPATWVGRAAPRPAPPPETYQPAPDPRRVVVVQVPRRSSGGRVALITIGVLAAFCALGGTALVLGFGWLTHTPATSAAPALPGLHTPVRDGAFEFVVTSASCGHHSVGKSIVTRTAQGQFCLVSVTVRNIGRDGRGFAEGFQKAIGPDGATYSPDTAAGVIVNGGGVTVWSTVNPGNSVSGTIVFDIPRTASITGVELHDSPFSGGARVAIG